DRGRDERQAEKESHAGVGPRLPRRKDGEEERQKSRVGHAFVVVERPVVPADHRVAEEVGASAVRNPDGGSTKALRAACPRASQTPLCPRSWARGTRARAATPPPSRAPAPASTRSAP